MASYWQCPPMMQCLRDNARASLILMIGCLLGASAASAEAGSATPRKEKPNILFAFADDWGRYASAYATLEPGGPSDIMTTPHFDRIAQQGALFSHAFVNAPSCTPCRSSLLSGQYFWRTGLGAILQGAVWDDSIPSYPLILRDAGYHIGHTYKVWSPGTPRDAPYGGAAFAYVRRGGHLNGFSQFVSGKANREEAKGQVMEEVRGNFSDFLEDREGRPFCYWFGPTNTHRKWVQGSGKELWGLDPDGLKGKMPSYLPDVPMIREDFCDYLGEAQAFDESLGVLLDELERIGELDNTMIVVSGDHGIPGFPRGKCNLYDLGVGVPLAVCWPDRIPGGRVIDDFVCLPDLAPTFVEVAGLTPPGVDDRAQSDESTDLREKWRRGSFADHVIVGRRAPRRGRSARPPALSPTRDSHERLPVHPQLPARSLADGNCTRFWIARWSHASL